MVIQVNQELCAGCGVCIEACSDGAIQLVDQRAVIDDALCTACEACIDACQNEAITARSILEPSVSIVTLPAAESHPVPVRDQAALLETTAPTRGLGPLAGVVLTFLGRDVAPRLVNLMIDALERRLARPATTVLPPLSTASQSLTRGSRGIRRQARYRGGRSITGNPKERR